MTHDEMFICLAKLHEAELREVVPQIVLDRYHYGCRVEPQGARKDAIFLAMARVELAGGPAACGSREDLLALIRRLFDEDVRFDLAPEDLWDRAGEVGESCYRDVEFTLARLTQAVPA